jgi:hypothetical protein
LVSTVLRTFQCALNNADCANDYVSRLTSSLQQDLSGLVSARNEHDREKVETCLAGFPAVAAKLKAVLEQVSAVSGMSGNRCFDF